MKTPEQWRNEELARGPQTQPAATLRWIARIQINALEAAAEIARKEAFRGELHNSGVKAAVRAILTKIEELKK